MRTNKSTQPKFKVGDVVEVTAKGRCAIEGAKGQITCIEQTNVENIINGEFYNLPKGDFYMYGFSWFEHPREMDEEQGLESWFRHCKGIRSRKLCSVCKYCQNCPKSPLNCKTGGKLVAKWCTKCKNRFICWTN